MTIYPFLNLNKAALASVNYLRNVSSVRLMQSTIPYRRFFQQERAMTGTEMQRRLEPTLSCRWRTKVIIDTMRCRVPALSMQPARFCKRNRFENIQLTSIVYARWGPLRRLARPGLALQTTFGCQAHRAAEGYACNRRLLGLRLLSAPQPLFLDHNPNHIV